MKKILMLILALSLLASFAACSAKVVDDPESSASTKATTTAATQDSDGSTATTSDTAATSDTSAATTEATTEAIARELMVLAAGRCRTDGATGEDVVVEIYTFEGPRLASIEMPEYENYKVTVSYDEDAKTARAEFPYGVVWDLQWDENGNITVLHETYDDGSEQTRTYTYDECGNMLSETKTEGDAVVGLRNCTYNEDGQILTETYVNRKGELTVNDLHVYDEHGNKVQKTDADGEVTTYVNVYDEAGNMVEQINDDSSMHTYSYDANGNLVERAYYRDDGTLSNTRTYTYTENGDLASESYYYASGTLNYTHTYHYAEVEMTAEEYRTAVQLIELILSE